VLANVAIHSRSNAMYVLDVVSLSEHDVVAVRAIDVKVNLADVGRPVVSSALHLLSVTHNCICDSSHTHTHTRLTALCPGLPVPG